NGRAWLRASGEGQPLVDHGKNASIGGINGHHGSVHVPKSVQRSLANHGIFTPGVIAIGNISRVGTGVEMFNVAMSANMPQPRASTGGAFCGSLCGGLCGALSVMSDCPVVAGC